MSPRPPGHFTSQIDIYGGFPQQHQHQNQHQQHPQELPPRMMRTATTSSRLPSLRADPLPDEHPLRVVGRRLAKRRRKWRKADAKKREGLPARQNSPPLVPLRARDAPPVAYEAAASSQNHDQYGQIDEQTDFSGGTYQPTVMGTGWSLPGELAPGYEDYPAPPQLEYPSAIPSFAPSGGHAYPLTIDPREIHLQNNSQMGLNDRRGLCEGPLTYGIFNGNPGLPSIHNQQDQPHRNPYHSSGGSSNRTGRGHTTVHSLGHAQNPHEAQRRGTYRPRVRAAKNVESSKV